MCVAVTLLGIIEIFTVIDLVILVFLVFSIGRGIRIGFFRQLFSIIGFFGGLFIGGLISPSIMPLFHDPAAHIILSPLFVLLVAGVFAGIGDVIGHKMRLATLQSRFRQTEPVLGIGMSITSVLISAWLLAAMIGVLPISQGERDLQNSFVVRTMNHILPPAPKIIARIGNYISPNGFPRVFEGPEPLPTDSLPTSPPDVKAAAEKASASTVKIQGIGCGGVLTGSGFILGKNLVATNAHVIAGVGRPVVYASNGRYPATPIFFDPETDVAFLKVPDIQGEVLKLAEDTAAKGTSAAVLGFPGGKSLEADPAVILSERLAVGRDIYDDRLTERTIYIVQTAIEQGNSGGPLVLSNGKVAGVIFAKSLSSSQVAYAITSQEIAADLKQVNTSTVQPVSTGPCAE